MSDYNPILDLGGLRQSHGEAARRHGSQLLEAVVLPIVAITPLVILPFSYHMEGERPTARSVAGGVLAVAGAAALAWATTHR